MGQFDVLRILKEEREYLSAKEIGKKLKISFNSISHVLGILLRLNEVKRIQVKEGQYWIYKYKIK